VTLALFKVYIGHVETDTRTKTQTRANGHLNYHKRRTVWEMGKNMENNFTAFESDERKKQTKAKHFQQNVICMRLSS
jgi:hypothetical protein